MKLYLQPAGNRNYRLSDTPDGQTHRSNEKLLKELDSTSEITVVYPPELSEQQARQIFRSMIDAQVQKHRRRMMFGGALLPFSIPLTLIPGPNVILFYLAWRTFSNYKSQKGGRRALGGLPLHFVAGN